MDARHLIDRREFTLQSALAILAAATITVSGCGGDSSPAPSPTPTQNPNPSPNPSGDATGTISGNHGHTAVITSAQLTAANGIQLNITGTATHPHTVTLSAAELTQIAAKQRVSKDSSTDDGHTHTVTFN